VPTRKCFGPDGLGGIRRAHSPNTQCGSKSSRDATDLRPEEVKFAGRQGHSATAWGTRARATFRISAVDNRFHHQRGDHSTTGAHREGRLFASKKRWRIAASAARAGNPDVGSRAWKHRDRPPLAGEYARRRSAAGERIEQIAHRTDDPDTPPFRAASAKWAPRASLERPDPRRGPGDNYGTEFLRFPGRRRAISMGII